MMRELKVVSHVVQKAPALRTDGIRKLNRPLVVSEEVLEERDYDVEGGAEESFLLLFWVDSIFEIFEQIIRNHYQPGSFDSFLGFFLLDIFILLIHDFSGF